MSSTAVSRHRAAAAAASSKVAAAPVARRAVVVRRLARLLGNLVMLACTLAFLAIAIGPHLFDYRTSTMLTGSMAPGINPGDMVVTMPKPTADLKVGDVISYQIP